MIRFDNPWLLCLLPLALLPLWARADHPVVNAWVALMPHDRASDALQRVLKGAAVLALALLVLAMAGPYRPEYTIERVGKGAEIVVVLDRSRSMDQGFAGARSAAAPRGTGPEAIDYYMSLSPGRVRDSKGKVARRLLSEFATSRPDDRFGMVVFSTLPMRVLEFTQKNEVVQAAIAAGEIGRGLSETNIGLALLEALSFFDERPYTGSRIVMLVSDGGDRLDAETQERIAFAARKHRAAIDWFYLRSANSPGLNAEAGDPLASVNTAADTVPEHQLHRFFQSLGTPYRAYEADNDKALQAAIDDVNRLENLPITYLDVVPRRDLSPYGHGAALLCVLLLLGAQMLEIKRWA